MCVMVLEGRFRSQGQPREQGGANLGQAHAAQLAALILLHAQRRVDDQCFAYCSGGTHAQTVRLIAAAPGIFQPHVAQQPAVFSLLQVF